MFSIEWSLDEMKIFVFFRSTDMYLPQKILLSIGCLH